MIVPLPLKPTQNFIAYKFKVKHITGVQALMSDLKCNSLFFARFVY